MRRSLAEILQHNVARSDWLLANVPRSKAQDWFLVFITQEIPPQPAEILNSSALSVLDLYPSFRQNYRPD